MNTPTGNTLSTAEHTFTLLLALSRRVAEAYAKLREGKWDRKTFMGTQLADKTLGIVGLGRIGGALARRARGFDMRVLYHQRTRVEEPGLTLIPAFPYSGPLEDVRLKK